MPSTTCTFTSPRGHELAARLERPAGPVRASVLFAHCFTCSKDLRAVRGIAGSLRSRDLAVMSVDFTGLGASGGSFGDTTFSHDVDDLVAAAAHLGGLVAPPTVLVGHSLGGAAALAAADRLPSVAAVATIGAPADVAHVRRLFTDDDLDRVEADGRAEVTIGGRRFTVGAALLQDLADQSLLDRVAALDASTLFMHAPLDDTVGIDNARLLFEAARHPKSFVSLDDADHLLHRPADARYVAEVVAAWAQRYVADADGADGAADADSDDPDGAVAASYADQRVLAVTTDGLRADVRARGFETVVDEPRAAGGTEQGPTPYDHLALALASCTSLTLRMYADRKDWPLEEVRVVADHERVHAADCERCETEEGDVGVLTRRITLVGDLDDDQRAGLLRIADRCPVHRTLEGTIEVHTDLVDA